MSLFALTFLNPLLLGALAALPIIYWLLRTTPPRPQQIPFPATRILVGIENRERTPARTPWWLMVLRLLAAALVICALAEPVLNPNRAQGLKGAGPVVIVVDNGWAAGARFQERQRYVERLINEAEAQSRPVLVAGTAAATRGQVLRVETAAAARSTAAALSPHPFEPDRQGLAERLAAALSGHGAPSVLWLSDGVDHSQGARRFGERLAAIAGSGGTLAIVEPGAGEEAMGLTAGVGKGGKLEATVLRPAGSARQGFVYAFSTRGQRISEVPITLGAGERRQTVAFDVPLELRNQVTRIEIAGQRSAGAVHLLDARSQWHRVGLISSESREQAQPLLSPLYYVNRALAPHAELVASKEANLVAAIDAIMKRNVSVLVLADIGTLTGEVKVVVEDFVKRGGVLVRFAGPRLEAGGDDLLPVALRSGGLTRGGALSWSKPEPLAPFAEDSLFAGLTIAPEVTVNRQILADPARLGADVRIWARLKDGTPLVTAQKRGDGQIVLFHVTANSEWSNLPLSGLFVEMLRRVSTLGTLAATASDGVSVADGAQVASTEVLAPTQTLDGYGVLKSPPPTAQAIAIAKLATLKPSAEHPPGYYGPQASPRAFNLIGPKTELQPITGLPTAFERRAYEGATQRALKPDLLTVALALLLIDVIAVLLLQWGPIWRRAGRVAGGAASVLAALMALGLEAAPAEAQVRPGFGTQQRPPLNPNLTREEQIAIMATSKVSFAYVITGDKQVDELSRQGLIGLGRMLTRRTSVEPGEPFGVNIMTDEIAFFPVLYWPVTNDAKELPAAVLAKIDAYMKLGGMIIFDTRDQGTGLPTNLAIQRGPTPLQRLIGRLDVPRLEPVGDHHVLTKSFYLIRAFPGRWEGGALWAEAESQTKEQEQGRKARRADGVTSILITSNDFAAAWATDERGQPLIVNLPGGDAQREMAIRVGINIIMYALTGNYKADQVHVPLLLERLGN